MGRPATHINLFDMVHCSQPIRAQGSNNVLLDGIPWSRMTDMNMPHLRPPGASGLPSPGVPSLPTVGDLLSSIGIPTDITDQLPIVTDAEPTPANEISPENVLCFIHQAPIAQGSLTVLVNGLGGGYISKKVLECTEVIQGLSSVICGG